MNGKNERIDSARNICKAIESNKDIGIKGCVVNDWNSEARSFSVLVNLDVNFFG